MAWYHLCWLLRGHRHGLLPQRFTQSQCFFSFEAQNGPWNQFLAPFGSFFTGKKVVLRGNRFFFFLRFWWNSDKKWWFHVFLWSKNLKPVVVSLKPGFFWWSWGRRPQLHQKNLCFNEYHHRFSSSYLQSNTWIPSFFCPSFIEYRQQNKKKYERVSFEIIH